MGGYHRIYCILSWVPPQISEVEEMLKERDVMLQHTKEHLVLAQDIINNNADENIRE